MTGVERLADDSQRIHMHLRFLDGQSGPIGDKSGRTGLIPVFRTQESVFSNPLSLL